MRRQTKNFMKNSLEIDYSDLNLKILDQYLINESIQTLKKIKEGFEQTEENSILQIALTFEL